MRKANQEIKDNSILEEILTQSQICRLAMVDNGEPYLLPFNYGYKNKTIYIHSAPEGRKIDILQKNPKVCFEIEQENQLIKGEVACKWSTLYRSVVGYGTVKIISDFNEKWRALEIIMKQHGYEGKIDFNKNEVEFIVILKLSITSISGKQSGNWNKIKG